MARIICICMPMICVFFCPPYHLKLQHSPKAFLRRWHRQNGRSADSHHLATAGHRLCSSWGAGRGAGALWTRKPWWADPDQAAGRLSVSWFSWYTRVLMLFWNILGDYDRFWMGYWDGRFNIDAQSMSSGWFFCGETDAEGLKNVWVLKQSGISLE